MSVRRSQAGAAGYVLKEAADTELVSRIREVASGGRYVHPELGARLALAQTRRSAHAPRRILSRTANTRCYGCSPSATRTRRSRTMLYISVRTAETHRAHIMQKLRLSTRAELVRYALDRGSSRAAPG